MSAPTFLLTAYDIPKKGGLFESEFAETLPTELWIITVHLHLKQGESQ